MICIDLSYCKYWCSHCEGCLLEGKPPMYPITDFLSHINIIHLRFLRLRGRMPQTCELWTSPDWVLSSDVSGTLFRIHRMLGKDSLALHWIWNCRGIGNTYLASSLPELQCDIKRMMRILADTRSSFCWLLLHSCNWLGLVWKWITMDYLQIMVSFQNCHESRGIAHFQTDTGFIVGY